MNLYDKEAANTRVGSTVTERPVGILETAVQRMSNSRQQLVDESNRLRDFLKRVNGEVAEMPNPAGAPSGKSDTLQGTAHLLHDEANMMENTLLMLNSLINQLP